MLRLPLSPAAIVWMLGATQILGYGTVYYSFAILAEPIARSLGLSVSTVFGLFSLSLLVGGVVAPFLGGRMDRHGAPTVMAIGSVAVAGLLAATAWAPGIVGFAIALTALQTAAPAILYDAAFTTLVQAGDTGARRRITHLTLIAGFASTLFWPLTSWLAAHMDWRGVLLVFAALNLVVCAPAHMLIARAPSRTGRAVPLAEPDAPAAPAPAASEAAPLLPEAIAGRVYGLMTLGFALSGFMLSALLAQMVPALTALGLGSAALVVSTLFGPAQVIVRFADMFVAGRRDPLLVTLFAMAMFPLAGVILAATAPSVAGAAVFAVLLGFGSGLKSILQGTLPLALFGRAAYGARLGRMTLARQFLAAAAPFLFAWILERLGATAALLSIAAVGIAGLACFVEIARLRRPDPNAAPPGRP
ncbi:arsenite efflux MFS transporter ArsK [Prosthecodimorpha staleyi]|uniref:Arsenite efflux MFS transporter ArsK n=1 Tax=Prosthecodimorpha staleyi TaxID=2840188 RepID=A0A947D588_9HYPH|nr:arsenite efflux MFS transporter ArsK [Prosthecodimorpha staleyi]MBT9288382.1 arsenite efflux MFS transporter ArsK [Prosthecodimorpha staleyi]